VLPYCHLIALRYEVLAFNFPQFLQVGLIKRFLQVVRSMDDVGKWALVSLIHGGGAALYIRLAALCIHCNKDIVALVQCYVAFSCQLFSILDFIEFRLHSSCDRLISLVCSCNHHTSAGHCRLCA